MRNLEHSFDRFPTRGMPTLPARHDPLPDRSTSERRGRSGHRTGIGGVNFAGERVEKLVFVGEQVRLSIQDGSEVAASDLVEHRQSFVTDPVA